MRSPEETNDTGGAAGPHLDEGTVHAWLDGQLTPAEGAALEAHAASCAECAALVAEARGLVAGATRILGALDIDAAPRGAASDASAAVPVKPTVAPTVVPIATRRRRRWVMPSAIAATLLIGALTLQQQRARDGSALVPRVASESAPMADTAPAPVPASPVSPLRVASPEPGTPTRTMAVGGGAAGAAVRAERIAVAPARTDEASRDLGRPLAPSEQTVANVAPTPAPAPPAAQKVAAAPIDTAMAKAAATAAFAEARRDSASSIAAISERRSAAQRAEAPPVQLRGRVAGVAADAAAPAAAPAGALTITGRVVDANRAPLQGTAVSVDGTNTGTITNAEGRFTLVVPATQRRGDSVTVVARRIGYDRARQTVASAARETTADFALRQATTALEAVVVTSIDAQKRAASATEVPQCYAASRPPSGVPSAFVLDAAAGRSFVRAGTRPGAGAEVGSWSASGGAVTANFTGTGGPRGLTFVPPVVGGMVQAPLGPGATIALRRVACGR